MSEDKIISKFCDLPEEFLSEIQETLKVISKETDFKDLSTKNIKIPLKRFEFKNIDYDKLVEILLKIGGIEILNEQIKSSLWPHPAGNKNYKDSILRLYDISEEEFTNYLILGINAQGLAGIARAKKELEKIVGQDKNKQVIVIDGEVGIYNKNKKDNTYRIKRNRFEIVKKLGTNKNFSITAKSLLSLYDNHQLLSQAISKINETARKKIGMKDDLIIRSRDGYGLNKEKIEFEINLG